MFVHKDSVDSVGVQKLMKIGFTLTLAGLVSSVYERTLHIGAPLLEVLVRDRVFQATLKLLLLALAVWVGTLIVVETMYKDA